MPQHIGLLHTNTLALWLALKGQLPRGGKTHSNIAVKAQGVFGHVVANKIDYIYMYIYIIHIHIIHIITYTYTYNTYYKYI